MIRRCCRLLTFNYVVVNIYTFLISGILAVDVIHNDDEEYNLANQLIDESLTLKQVHVITRHGSRYPLVKLPDNLFEVTSGLLTANGEKQLYELGKWLKKRYNDVLNGQFDQFISKQVIFESSAFDRTIVSANSLASGLYDIHSRDPHNETSSLFDSTDVGSTTITNIRPIVPVYTMQDIHDIYIRAYDKCPTYIDALDELYNSNEWKQLEIQNTEALRTLANITIFQQYKDETTGLIPLKELYNVYDMINVAFTECHNPLEPVTYDNAIENYTYTSWACDHLGYTVDDFSTLLNNDQFDFNYIFTDLTHQLELMRYSTMDAGMFVGGNLLDRIMNRMTYSTFNSETFYVYSGHYPTILGILAAMNDIIQMNLDMIPSYSSALIFELYTKTDTDNNITTDIVKILYRDGDNNMNIDASELIIPYIVWDEICFDDSCPLNTLLEHLDQLMNVENWCTICNNTVADRCVQQKSDICDQEVQQMLQEMNNNDTNDNAAPTSSSSSSRDSRTYKNYNTNTDFDNSAENDDKFGAILGFGIIIGLVIGYIPVIIWCFLQRRRNNKNKNLTMMEAQQQQGTIDDDVKTNELE